MKRIDYIAKGCNKGIISDTITIREKKVRRVLDEMIDAAEEKAIEARYEATKVINDLKDVADDRQKISAKLNRYVELMDDVEGYERSKKHLEKVKVMLDEEIVIEED